MKKMPFKALIGLLLAGSMSTAFAAAALPDINEAGISAEEKGLRIATVSKAKDEGWGDSQSDMVMIIRDAKGKETIREMRAKSLEVLDDGDKSLSIFDRPKDVSGTAFLTFSHATTPDDQWLYLPALKRVKRINSKNKSGPFMGSEFAYEDMSSPEIAKYTYKYLRDEVLDGQDTYVLDTFPTDKTSGYSKRTAWIEKKDLKNLKVEFYDRKGALLKTLVQSDFVLYLDKHWRANKAVMVNHQTGKSTEIQTKNNRFKTGLTDADFDKSSLKRMK
jgi:outer membrane lipoprotein-sorting protein